MLKITSEKKICQYLYGDGCADGPGSITYPFRGVLIITIFKFLKIPYFRKSKFYDIKESTSVIRNFKIESTLGNGEYVFKTSL